MLFVVIAMIALAAWPAQAQRLEAPFDVAERRAAMGRTMAPATCPAPSPPQRDVMGETFYSDPAFSVVDPARLARSRELQRPFDEFAATVLRFANDHVRSRPADPARAACALAHLDHWAVAEAMLGRTNSQGGYTRKWTLNSLALAFLMIRDAPGLDPVARARVARWIGRVGHAVIPYYTNAPPSRTGARNNHLNWAAATAIHAGVAADDRALFDWAIAAARRALAEVQADGSLPLEVARGRLATHYHVFALAPLVQVALTARANGIDLTRDNDRALARLAQLTFDAMRDPTLLERRNGVAQRWPEGSGRGDHAWVELFVILTGDRAFATVLRAWRPIAMRWLGGDVTLLFGAAL